jgi:DNA-binding transcriptional regulator LsrR (DeoR family)
MLQLDEQRQMARVARLYHEHNLGQQAIARRLGLSQATVSRLYNRARSEGIIKITVSVPSGVYSELEEKLIDRYGLRDAVVVDCHRDDDETVITRELGSAAGFYLESIIKRNDVIGLSSWSATLLALVDSLHPMRRKTNVRVLQILGGVGNPSAETHANRLTGRFADLVGGKAIFLPAPGIVGTEAARKVLLDDVYVRQAIGLFGKVTLALVGIGTLMPSSLLAASGNSFSADEQRLLRNYNAVGDILLHFYDRAGRRVQTFLDQRVVSMSLEQLRAVDRAIGVAGGRRKVDAIRGALAGRWINILITDRFTAERLVKPEP